MALLHLNYRSKYLTGDTDVHAVLPELPGGVEPKDFYSSGEKYPVLWLLHGSGGDSSAWIRQSNVMTYAMKKRVIVVMPCAMSTNYMDWNSYATGYMPYTNLLEELMPLVYNWLPASADPKDNFIAGNSMGGRGACIYAFSHPEKFAGVYSMSGAPQDLRTHMDDPFFAQRNQNMIAEAGSLEAWLKLPVNTWDKTAELAKFGEALPALYFACGTEDPVAYGDFCTFRKYAEQVGLPATFLETEGYVHEWPFWDLCVKDALDRFFPER